MLHFVVLRFRHVPGKAMYSDLHVFKNEKHVYHCKGLELPWMDNKPQESCIPAGTYQIDLEFSPAFKMKLWEIKNVPNRAETKIHTANYVHQLRGCIAPGEKHIDINADGVDDVNFSEKHLSSLMKAVAYQTNPTRGKITIVDIWK